MIISFVIYENIGFSFINYSLGGKENSGDIIYIICIFFFLRYLRF